jgi:hypothetical protein
MVDIGDLWWCRRTHEAWEVVGVQEDHRDGHEGEVAAVVARKADWREWRSGRSRPRRFFYGEEWFKRFVPHRLVRSAPLIREAGRG